MKRFIWLPLAGFLLIAGATVAAAAPSILSITSSALGTTDSQALDHPGARAGGLLEEVLAELVGSNEITQAQSDAITAALAAKVDTRQDDMEAQRALMQGFIEDGVITQAEIDQLPADSPLRQAFDSIATDGQVTLDQLRELGPGRGPGFGGRGMGHGHHGAGPWMDGPDAPDAPDATDNGTPAPSTN